MDGLIGQRFSRPQRSDHCYGECANSSILDCLIKKISSASASRGLERWELFGQNESLEILGGTNARIRRVIPESANLFSMHIFSKYTFFAGIRDYELEKLIMSGQLALQNQEIQTLPPKLTGDPVMTFPYSLRLSDNPWQKRNITEWKKLTCRVPQW